MAACHEQAVFLAPAEGQVGAAFGQANEADRLAFGVEHHDAVEVLGFRRSFGCAPTRLPLSSGMR
jgi:hypothetical protein